MISIREEHPVKALRPIDFNPLPKVTLVILEQSAKAKSGMDWTPFGITISPSRDEQYENALLPAKYINAAFKHKQYAITPGTTGSVAIFNGADSRGGSQFTERAIYDGSTTYDSTTDADKLITAGAVDNKQNKMTCTRWLDTPENPDHTDENCLLWSIAN